MRHPFALADREVGAQPRHDDYDRHADYASAWYYWRAVRRDAYPTPAELDARMDALAWAIDRHARDTTLEAFRGARDVRPIDSHG